MIANSRYRTILPDPAAMMDIGDCEQDAKGSFDYRVLEQQVSGRRMLLAVGGSNSNRRNEVIDLE